MSTNSIGKDTIFLRVKEDYFMQVQSPEIIREKAGLTRYRMAKMMGISQRNYADIVSGKIKIPSGKPVVILIMIGVEYANMPESEVIDLVCTDFGISAHELTVRYNKNRKVHYKNKR